MDLREKLNIEKKEDNENTRIIIVHLNDMEVGLIVDSASKVIEINSDMIEAPPDSLREGEENVIYGIGKIDENVITILDVEKILTA